MRNSPMLYLGISRVASGTVMSVALLLLMLCTIDNWPALAQTPVAIHATQEEINIWRQRRVHGPYLDDWQRILTRADAFRTTPHADLWPGNQVDQVWKGAQVKARQQPLNHHPKRRLGDGLRDAGFVYLITGDTAYRDAVRQALLTQVAMPGTDFNNAARWSPTATGFNDNNLDIVSWLRKLTYGYSYIRASLPQTDREPIERWLLNAATFWDRNVYSSIADRFPKRYQDDYSKPQSDRWPGASKGKTHWEGPTVYDFHGAWFNKATATNALVGAVGALLDNKALKDHAKRFVKEWLMFCVAADGTVVDQFRWNEGEPQIGYVYAGTALGSIITTVDHLARAGDTELYDYETSSGFYGWEGGPKSLRLVVQRYAKLTLGERGMDGGVLAYASKDDVLTRAKLIGPGTTRAHDVYLMPANLYYKDATVKKAYLRLLPQKPQSGGYDPWGGDWGTYPGIRFMFGQLEGTVWPYPPRQPATLTGAQKP